MTTPLSLSPAADLVPSWTQFFLPGTDDSDAPGAPQRQESASELAGEALGDRAGTVFGEFELLHLLGRGGMGEVYEALYRADRQRYAVKILAREHRDNPTMVTRFEHEFWALRRCRHAGIVGALFAGVEDGERFYVMDLLRGESLEDVLRRGRLASERVAQIGVQLSRTLSALHAEGVLHRDLKPGNVLLLDERGPDGADQVRLIDLGIAKLLPRFYRDVELRTPPEKRLMTQAGARLGTPGYMAPEVGLGSAPSEAQDVFSLGVTLFRLATGRMPYSEVLPLEIGDEPRWAEDLGCPIPTALETVLRRAVDMDPKVRQPSMTRLCEELETVAEELAAEKDEEEDLETRSAERSSEAVEAETKLSVGEGLSVGDPRTGLEGSTTESDLPEELERAEPEVERVEDPPRSSAERTGEEAGSTPFVVASARGSALEGSTSEPARGFSWPGRGFWIGLGVGVGIASLLGLRPATSESWMPAHASALRASMPLPPNAPSSDETMLASAEGAPSERGPTTSADPQTKGVASKPEAFGEHSENHDPEESAEIEGSEEPAQAKSSLPIERESTRAAARTPKMIAKRWAGDHDPAIQRCIGSLRTLGAVAITLHVDATGEVSRVTSLAEMPSLVRRCLHESFSGLDLGPGRGDRTIRLTLSRGAAKR